MKFPAKFETVRAPLSASAFCLIVLLFMIGFHSHNLHQLERRLHQVVNTQIYEDPCMPAQAITDETWQVRTRCDYPSDKKILLSN